jgi:hypothetical protein
MVALVHGLRQYLELHQHPRVADVSRICLLNDGVSPHQEMPQPLLLLVPSFIFIAGAGAVSVKGEGDESADEFTCNRSYGRFHGLHRGLKNGQITTSPLSL